MVKNQHSSQQEALAYQTSFLENLQGQPFRELFEHLPGVYFFIKDAQSRMVCASRPILDRFGLEKETDIVGTSDYDYFPEHIAAAFVRDDQWVLKSGQALLNRVEVWYNAQRLLDWYLTNKLPLRDHQGKVVGIMGTVQSYEDKKRMVLPVSQIEQAVAYIQSNLGSQIKVDDIARQLGFSSRQLHRRFQEVFGMNVRDFIMRSRINEATEKLSSSAQTLSDIAIDCGFCDQSAFTAQFKKITGMTPLKFRQRYQ
ncbi:MAG: AraC family transcriptional regulator [Verrucomicrobiota bacterium]